MAERRTFDSSEQAELGVLLKKDDNLRIYAKDANTRHIKWLKRICSTPFYSDEDKEQKRITFNSDFYLQNLTKVIAKDPELVTVVRNSNRLDESLHRIALLFAAKAMSKFTTTNIAGDEQ